MTHSQGCQIEESPAGHWRDRHELGDRRRTEQEEEEVILCVTVIITSVMSLASLGLCHCEADLIGIILPLFNGKVPWNSGITF